MEAIDLIESMLQYSSRKRPTATEILKHEYFQGVTVNVNEGPNKETVFTEKPAGVKLDTKKQDDKIDEFRATKDKFRKTRFNDANKSNLFRQMDEIDKNKSGGGGVGGIEGEDIDSILSYLENKNKKKDVPKLPVITNTKDKFYKPTDKK